MQAMQISDTVAALRQVNLNHLVYFWSVGRCGSFTRASRELGVSQPSISEQVAGLERRLGRTLFTRTGRGAELTADGQRVFRYAEEVVGMCAELVRTRPVEGTHEPVVLHIGAADGVPKIVVRSILTPLMEHVSRPSIVVREWRTDQLLTGLSLRKLDLVICDHPISQVGATKVVSFEALSSGMTMCAAAGLASRLQKGFPRSLNGAPVAMPVHGVHVRAAIDKWFVANGVAPRIVVEAEDRALMHHFAEAGMVAMAVATVTLDNLKRQFGLHPIGAMKGVTESYCVVMSDRPATAAALHELRESLSTKHHVRKPRVAAR